MQARSRGVCGGLPARAPLPTSPAYRGPSGATAFPGEGEHEDRRRRIGEWSRRSRRGLSSNMVTGSRWARANGQAGSIGRAKNPGAACGRLRRRGGVRRNRRARGRPAGSALDALEARRRGEHIAGKTVIDACNPIGGGPPVHGVLTFLHQPDRFADGAPAKGLSVAAHFVKAFNSVGAAQMVDPQFAGGKPTMFICGDHEGGQAGRDRRCSMNSAGRRRIWVRWRPRARSSRLCMLWCIPGVARNGWSPHAFKLLRGEVG